MKLKTMGAIFGIIASTATLTACDPTSNDTASDKATSKVNKVADNRSPYVPKNNVEFNNYNNAQKLFDDPNTIIWCTTSLPNDSSPLVTVPIKGKLTSSSTSYFPGHTTNWSSSGSGVSEEARSVDGMYHGNPPAYRFGFTPSGQYVSFENMETFCTTQLTDFQRQKSYIDVTGNSAAQTQANDAQNKAQEALKKGDSKKATELLQQAAKAGK